MLDIKPAISRLSQDKFFIWICVFMGTSLWALKNGALLYPIDASVSLYLSGNFKNEYSLVLDWARNSWSIIHQVGSFFLSIGLDYELISKLFSLLSSVSLFVGVGLILRSLKIGFIYLIPLTTLVCLFKILPSLSGDYLFEGVGTKHLSHFSLALILLSFGLALSGKQFFSTFIGTINIAVHPFFGVFFLPFILILNLQLNRVRKNNHHFLLGGTIGLIISLVSFSLYIFYRVQHADLAIDKAAFDAYLEYWDAHRNLNISSQTVFLSILFPLLFLFLLKRLSFLKNEEKLTIKIFSFIILISTSLILIPKFYEGSFARALELITPGRFMVFNGIFIFFSIFYFLFRGLDRKDDSIKAIRSRRLLIVFNIIFLVLIAINNDFLPFFHTQVSRNLITVFLVFFFPAFIYLIIYFAYKSKNVLKEKFLYKNFNFIMTTLIISLVSFNFIINKQIRCTVDGFDHEPVLIASRNELFLLRSCLIPIIIDTENLDVIPYLPHKSDELEKIISSGYGIDYYNPPISLRYTAKLNDNKTFIYKKIWEERTKGDWLSVKKELNTSLIATPPNWHLNLNKVIDHDNINIYLIED